MTEAIRVVIVDDQELVRAGLRPLAERDGDITVIAEAADGRAGLSFVRELRPDVVLMDIRMPAMDGIEATGAIVADEALNGVRTSSQPSGRVLPGICSRTSLPTICVRRSAPLPPVMPSCLHRSPPRSCRPSPRGIPPTPTVTASMS
nr:response regulator transcription factor [Brevibacterium limosum]